MALFGKKNQSSSGHHIIDVIKYDGSNDVLIWKHPCEDFNTRTQLIVGHSQEAIFVKGGQILGRFIPGTYTLTTQNYTSPRMNVYTAPVPFEFSVENVDVLTVTYPSTEGPNEAATLFEPIVR